MLVAGVVAKASLKPFLVPENRVGWPYILSLTTTMVSDFVSISLENSSCKGPYLATPLFLLTYMNSSVMSLGSLAHDQMNA